MVFHQNACILAKHHPLHQTHQVPHLVCCTQTVTRRETSLREAIFQAPHNRFFRRLKNRTHPLPHLVRYMQTETRRETSLRKILRSMRPQAGEDMTIKLEPLVEVVSQQLQQADSVLSSRVFVGVARGLWDRQAREVLKFLESKKEGSSWFKSASAGMALEVNSLLSLPLSLVSAVFHVLSQGHFRLA